jgi:uncharacterized protein (TIGR00369 family)
MSAPEEEVRFPDGACFGCSRTNPVGLGLRFWRRGDEVLTRHVVAETYAGSPGVVHGGIVATIIDEVCCALIVFVRHHYVVTGEMTVRYERPCPTGVELEVVARIVEKRPRYYVVESDVLQGGERLARSTGRFFPVETPRAEHRA